LDEDVYKPRESKKRKAPVKMEESSDSQEEESKPKIKKSGEYLASVVVVLIYCSCVRHQSKED
jgi:hypothetical protein